MLAVFPRFARLNSRLIVFISFLVKPNYKNLLYCLTKLRVQAKPLTKLQKSTILSDQIKSTGKALDGKTFIKCALISIAVKIDAYINKNHIFESPKITFYTLS